ncbi:MAG: NAD(P)-dependent oxidoreductase [Synergistaceae bacterium]|nr:NAD(P)-dependent oxidoreductase [Synergistaceae bacterium]
MGEKSIIGFIGTGVMGSSMAGHLLAGGNEVHVYNRTKSKAEKLIQAGAVWEDSHSELASKCSIIFTIVGYPKDVEDVYLGKNGIIESAMKGSLLVDMTTSSPKLAGRIWEEARSKGISVLDAPVTGGDKGAREAKLTVLVGGEKEDFERALPYFRLMGTNIRHMGKAGCGQYTKLVNQITLAGTMTGMCEGLAFAKGCGLDQKEVLEAISGGAAGSWSLTNYGPRILNGDFDPGFFVKHYIKDMKLAEESANEIELDLPALSLTRELYEEISEGGLGEAGTQSLYCLYDPEEE